MVADNKLPSMILTMAEIYNENSDDDGFLYVTYASEEMFGWRSDFFFYWSLCNGDDKNDKRFYFYTHLDKVFFACVL